MQSYLSIHEPMGRGAFAKGVIIIWVAGALLAYGIFFIVGAKLSEIAYLITKSIFELCILFLCIPLILRRLKDLAWPLWLSAIFFLPWFLNIRNFILVGLLRGESVDIRPLFNVAEGAAILSALVFLLLLLFRHGREAGFGIEL